MGEWPQVDWAAIAAMPWEGDAILGAPRRNAFGTTALAPPVLAERGPIMTNTIEAEAPEPVDIHRMMDDMQAFQAAEEVARQRYVDAEMRTVVDLSERGQDEQAFAILRSLMRPEPFWATRFEPGDRRRP